MAQFSLLFAGAVGRWSSDIRSKVLPGEDPWQITLNYLMTVVVVCGICTMMWTPWSDPIYFYIGDSMPDTAHHQPGETIADEPTVAAFTLTPNPAHGYVSLSVDSPVPVDGFLLTIHT